MKKKRKFFYFVPFIIIAIAGLLSAAVLLLWNNVLSEVVNVRQILVLEEVARHGGIN